MAGQRTRQFFLLAAGGLWLAGCVPGTSGDGTPVTADGQPVINATVSAPTDNTKMAARDVEAPDVFQASGPALWDGRPSLGGVWVASPDAKDPQRVIIRNPANGKFVIGALFHREPDNPGPALQISSDAAVALDILAGNPVKITVTALKRETAPPPKPAAQTPLVAGAETPAPAAQGGPSSTAAQTAPPARPGSDTATAAPAPATTAPSAAPPAPNPPPTKIAPVKTAPVTVTPVAPLSTGDVAAGAAAAIDSAVSGQPSSPAAQTPPAARPTAAAAAPPPAATGPEVQIGIFSTEKNALRAVGILAKHGVVARIRIEQSHGKTYWRVTARGDKATLARVRAAGFKDAYILK